MQHNCFILLGSNIGDSKSQLVLAISKIEMQLGNILKKSAYYQTAAWGNTQQNDFINQVIEIETNHTALEALKTLLGIETQMGRTRINKWEPRVIDLDILYFDSLILNSPELIVPHPYLQDRKFTLEPLCEIAPNHIHPVFNKTNLELNHLCTDNLLVQKLN